MVTYPSERRDLCHLIARTEARKYKKGKCIFLKKLVHEYSTVNGRIKVNLEEMVREKEKREAEIGERGGR